MITRRGVSAPGWRTSKLVLCGESTRGFLGTQQGEVGSGGCREVNQSFVHSQTFPVTSRRPWPLGGNEPTGDVRTSAAVLYVMKSTGSGRQPIAISRRVRGISVADFAAELEKKRRKADRDNQNRRDRRAFIVFATDPEKVGADDYRLTFACEAKTQAEAERKVRHLTGEQRRVAAYLASGKYKNELPEARWVA